MRKRLLLALGAFVTLSLDGAAGDGLVPPPSLRKTCTSATDQCRVCRIDPADGSILGCSFPGIACLPEAWRCTDPAADPPPSKATAPQTEL